ncbi:peptidoglycan editing factor PgeF [Ignatzschineria ureiclastica]|uniref:Purine nucleoside phosphorylase n=1 Tax=Ignatzschineria ureiclastica TaxID=472582 RepID=A0A2U2AEH8_9GAMM|nr:peptidoglycan editing factor PgeF [Ignatzschineria ureiclastica]
MEIITPNWPISSRITAFTTTRKGGVSEGDFKGLNMGLSTADDPRSVMANRQLLQELLTIPASNFHLTQIHSNLCVPVDEKWAGIGADACYTDQANLPAMILTADCLPILVTNRAENRVIAIHAGWRSLLMDIIENSIRSLTALGEKPEDLFVWLGPAISQKAFEVGNEVRQAFLYRNTLLENIAIDAFGNTIKDKTIESDKNPLFIPSDNEGKYYADIYQLAKLRLYNLGIPTTQIYGGDLCTYSMPEYFYSYRRDGAKSGRMASYIWINS